MDVRLLSFVLTFLIGFAFSFEVVELSASGSKCRRPNVPDMLFNCTDRSSVGSMCKLRCRRGFQLIGERYSNCTSDGFNPTIDNNVCIRETRMCDRISRLNMNYRCTDGNRRDSVCRLKCEDGFHLDGIRRTKCRKNGFMPSPENNECVPNFTTRAPPNPLPNCYRLNDPDLLFDCTNGNQVDSECEMRCRRGTQLIGIRTTTCTSNGFNPPIDGNRCIRETRTCKRIKKPNMKYRCTDVNFRHSVCRIYCDSGYRLQGIRVTECKKSGFKPSPERNECIPH